MGVGHQEVADSVVLPGAHAGDAAAAPALGTVGDQGLALRVAAGGQGDNHLLVRYQILLRELLRLLIDDLRPAVIPEAPLDVLGVVPDEVIDLAGVGQQVLQVGDLLDDLRVLLLDLLPLQAGQAAQLHVQHGLGLAVAEPEGGLHQPLLCLLRRGRAADRPDHLVQLVQRLQQPLQDVAPLLRLLQVVLRAAADHLPPVDDERLQHALQAHRPRLAVHQGQHVEGEGGLHGRVLVQVAEDLPRLPLPLQLDDDAHAVAVGLVPQLGDAVDPLVAHLVGDLLDEGRLVRLVGQFADHDLVASSPGHLLDVGAGADDDPPSAVGVGGADSVTPLAGGALAVAGRQPHRLVAEDDAAGGEVRPPHDLGQVGRRRLRVLYQVGNGVAHLAQVVGRDVGGHPHGDPGGPVHQQVGQPRRQHDGLLKRPVEVGREVHRVALDIGQRLLGDGRQAGLRVAHRRRRVVVDGAEVALAVHQRVAHGELLGHAHHRLVHGVVAVGVVLAQHFAHDSGRLPVGGAGAYAHVMHGVEDAALHRLQAVPHVRQRPGDDDRHGVVEVGGAHLLLDLDGTDIVRGHSLYGHSLSSCQAEKPACLPTGSVVGTPTRWRR